MNTKENCQICEPMNSLTSLDSWKKFIREYKDISWLWFRVLDDKQKKEFETALVREKHPLAYEIGTAYWRFEQFYNQSI